MNRRLSISAILGLAATATLVFGLRPVSPPQAEARPEPQVAVWSARRAPEALADAVGSAQLPVRLREAVAGTDACFILAEGAQRAFAHQPNASLIPASTQKLLTGAAALAALGPNHRFETRVLAAGPVAAGRVDRLWLVGGGDPFLSVASYRAFLELSPLTRGHPSTPLEDLADAVVAAGVREVTGPVLGDDSRHQGAPTVPTWRETYIADHDVPYLSALTANGGWSAWEGGKVTADDPAAYAASQLAALLEERGVSVGAGGGRGTAPGGGAVIARIQSPPLAETVSAMVRESDNLVAELLLREIGVARGGDGTTEAGAAALEEVLAEVGVDTSGVGLVDGSGLDRGNRASCEAVFSALGLRSEPEFEAVGRGLAVAGETGTLSRRFRGTSLEGRLRAKTGSLRDVVGLVGLLEERAGGRPDLSFALIANGEFRGGGGAGIQDDIAAILDAYPFPSADPAVLAPPPARRRQ